ncbi:hypothetical protein ELBI_85 [Anabaena phage Elbi]|nr:hypothetical protein ELBI_85 [Anabaena phage Elbi]
MNHNYIIHYVIFHNGIAVDIGDLQITLEDEIKHADLLRIEKDLLKNAGVFSTSAVFHLGAVVEVDKFEQ